MNGILNLHDYQATKLEDRLALARRDHPGMKVVYVGRGLGSPLANPFKEGDGERKVIIARYKAEHLWPRLKRKDKATLDALRALDDNTILACWCYPQPCHSNVIWDAWHWAKSTGLI